MVGKRSAFQSKSGGHLESWERKHFTLDQAIHLENHTEISG